MSLVIKFLKYLNQISSSFSNMMYFFMEITSLSIQIHLYYNFFKLIF